MLSIITKLFGTKSDRDVKVLTPYVARTNEAHAQLTALSDDGLREKTQELRGIIETRLKELDNTLASLRAKIEENPELDLNEKEGIFNQIDKLEKERDKELEVVLLEILPQAFALIKETARRFKEVGRLEVTTTPHDRALAVRKKNVEITDDRAVWHNRWMAAGNEIVWDMLHYDVQIIGGVVLHQGKIAEMATGEGKTLVATLPAFLNALAGKGVHIVTVNDYLAKRDSEWMAPLFEFHGMLVDCIDKHEPNTQARRNAYLADVTYGTNNEFGFDYLRDNMARSPEDLVQRKHHYAMVDEVDSVLIDDARTPLIISGPIPRGDEHEFYELKPRVARIVEAQRKIVNEFLNESRKKITAGDEGEKGGGLALFRAYRGLPKSKPLIKFLSETGNRTVVQKTENYYLQDHSKMMPEADAPLYFTIDEKNNQIDLTEKGIDFITGEGEDPGLFILPDIGGEIANIENDRTLADQDRLHRKEALISDYTVKTQRIHTINQLLKAYTLFEKDDEYIIVEGKVKIVDEQTGRVMEGRRYSDGLHQAIEAKENVKVEEATQTYATVTLQNYFRMYHKLAGMTGTAETEAGEFWEIYKLDVVVIPTNKPSVRKDQEDKVFKTVREKYNAVADEIVSLTEQGRPVLVGTTSVEISELLSRMLAIRKIKHQVLNAKFHQKEAEVVAEAGKPSTVTIATNRAGRGTDIKLTPDSRGAGGLAIVGTERHESRRVDRQLRGRSGRQGDPGTSQFFVSLEDNLMRLFGSDRIAKWMDRMGLEEGEVIEHSMITKSIERAQKKVEENNFGIRKRLLEYDDVMNYQREAIYTRRRNALFGDRLALDTANTLYDTCEDLINGHQDEYDNFKVAVISVLGLDTRITREEFEKPNVAPLTAALYREADGHYREKNQRIAAQALPVLKDVLTQKGAAVEEIVIPFGEGLRQMGVVANLRKTVESEGRELTREMEKAITLAIIDQEWKEHLRDMDDLKQSVQNAVFEQKDPLLVYKFESVELFKRFVSRVNQDTISFLMKADIPTQNSEPVREAQRQTKSNPPAPRMKTSKAEAASTLADDHETTALMPPPPVEKAAPLRSDKIANRNDRVSVQYRDGRVKRDVKYKTVEEDVRSNRCILIE